ncbi:sodium/proline symporter [Thalassotalea sp. M1531]|uniref:Sodium/proline symporter n=1 Tax=Thalassotalea algicola TaxID=2716224 RepID=A0A7Y0Q6M1_9GAMM|nr:sodium/proline symporter [Thalassotalea algicola]NMP30110.1 sodium/proline symporter [Thalassotalea algicola]
MDRQTVVLATLVAYKVLLIAIGFWASRRTHSSEDFFIGGKTLGPWVAATSSSASASSAWSLLGVSGAAFTMGLSSLWLFPAVVLGYMFNWLWIAPRIRHLGNKTGAITLTELLAGEDKYSKLIIYSCTFIIVFSFAFYIAAQFQAAGGTFATTFNMNSANAIMLGTGIILVYTLLGGFWAVSVTDTLQGLLMALTSIILPIAALVAVGGFGELFGQLQHQFSDVQLSITGAHSGWFALAFAIGLLGVGLGNPGQPHVVNRFMALKDENAVRVGKYIGIAWPIIVIGGMLILGLCARVLLADVSDNEQVLFSVTNLLFPPIIAGIFVAAVLSAIMSTADSQLLVSASSLSYDLKLKGSPEKQLLLSRLTVAGMCIVSLFIALYAPEAIFSRVLFAWAAIGSAFGPLLIILLMGYQVKGSSRLAAVIIGFSLTVYFNWQENSPGDILERVLPFFVALLVAYLGRYRTNQTKVK